MSRGALVVALLLSLGVNLGLVGIGVARRRAFDRGFGDGAAIDRLADRVAERNRLRETAGGGLRPEEIPEELLGQRLAERLELDGERRERFVVALRRMAGEVGESRREIRRVRDEMRREIGAASPDRARIDELLDELAKAEVRLNRAFVDGVLEARAELDEDESRRLLFLMAELGVGRGIGEPRGPRQGLGGPPLGRRAGEERRALSPDEAAPATPRPRP